MREAAPGVWLYCLVKPEVRHDTTSFSFFWEDNRVSVWLGFRLNEKFILSYLYFI